jgi:hypothetical protein
MTARPSTKPAGATRQIHAVERHRRASQVAVTSFAASIVAVMAAMAPWLLGNSTVIPRMLK